MPSSPDREARPDQLEVVRIVLEAGDFIHPRRGEPHALEALVDSSALLTLCIAKAS
jgi:quercetin dioxygenase-like cupin family protein